MPQAATIKSLPCAFRMMKAMQAEGIEWGEDYRVAAAGLQSKKGAGNTRRFRWSASTNFAMPPRSLSNHQRNDSRRSRKFA